MTVYLHSYHGNQLCFVLTELSMFKSKEEGGEMGMGMGVAVQFDKVTDTLPVLLYSSSAENDILINGLLVSRGVAEIDLGI